MKSKIKIMKARPEISDEEIRSYMDFDKLLMQKQSASLRRNRQMLKGGGMVVIAAIAVATIWYFARPIVETPTAAVTQEPIEEVQSQQMEKPAPTDNSADTLQGNQTQVPQLQESTGAKNEHTTPANPAASAPVEEIEKVEPHTAKEKTETSTPIYVQAEPQAGYPALYEYFARELTYPAEALKDSIEGVVTVVFTIGTAGKPEKILVDQSLGQMFDEEAMRVIRNMPLWKPATYNGAPVPSRLSVPLTFQIKKIKSK